MLDFLIKKFESWSYEKANSFHKNLIRDNIEGRYVWDYTDDGFVLYRDSGCYYFTHMGKIFILTSASEPHDFETHKLFYNQIKDNKSIRIDIPVLQQQIELDNKLFYYKEFLRPNNEFGRDFHLDIFDKKVNDDYVRIFIDDAALVFQQLKILNSNHDIMFPEVGLSFFKRMYDSQGNFWIDFKRWKIDHTKFLEVSLDNLNIVMFYIEYNNINRFDRESLMEEAREKWNLV